jgi:dolichyl-phosphate-mannose-protein mannosyltransferase
MIARGTNVYHSTQQRIRVTQATNNAIRRSGRRGGAADAPPRKASAPFTADPNGEAPTAIAVAVGAAVAAVVGILYFATAARDIVLGDTPELITAAITLGVPHPPGYPLFAMLGHLFSLLPAGPLPFRVDLLSVVCGAGTALLVYMTALRITGTAAASACAALVLAFTPLVWSWALVAEVFPLNNFFAAAVIYCLLTWYERPRHMRFLVAAAFLFGLGLSNHHTIVLVSPAVLFLLWRRRKELISQPRAVAGSVAATVLGLLPYAYLPWAAARHPLWNWGDPSSLTNLWAVVARKHFGSGRLTNAPQYMGGSPFDRLEALGASFGILAGILLLVGAVQAYRRSRSYFWFALLSFTFTGVVFAAYANMNLSAPLTGLVLERFFLLPQVAVAPLIAFGVLLGAELFASVAPRVQAQSRVLISVTVLLAVAGSVAANYRRLDQSRNHATRTFAEDIFATLKPDSIVMVVGDEVISPLVYLQYVEGYRKDVAVVVMPLLYTEWYPGQIRRQYPNVVVPFAHYGGPSGSMRAFVEANGTRPISVMGIDSDDSLRGRYWFYQRGLVADVEPMAKDVTLDQMIAETEQVFSRYRPPSPRDIPTNSLEQSILSHYAMPAIVAGGQCEQVHYLGEARVWYQRALKLNPSLPYVREALARVARDQPGAQ